MQNESKVLVTGATGNVGREIVKQMLGVGQAIRVMSRNVDKVTFANHVEVVGGDLTNAIQVKEALKGVRKVFLIHVPGADSFPQVCREMGVEHIVFLSSSAIESATENAIGRMHAHTESLIDESRVDWTFLRPDAFMSNSLQWAKSIREEGVVRAAFGHVKSTPIDPRDIAAVAVKALCSVEHARKIYTLTGPETVTPKDQAQIIQGVLGKKVEFIDIPGEMARQQMLQYAPKEIVDALFTLSADSLADPKPPTKTVEDVTGMPAHTFEQWVMDNRAAFR